MVLFCRNPKCENFSRPTQVTGDATRCPLCQRPFLGGSVGAAESIARAPAPAPEIVVPVRQEEPPTRAPKEQPHGAKPPAPKPPSSTPDQRSALATPRASRSKPEDPNLTRPIDGFRPELNRKPRFVLELIERGQVYPIDFVDETRATPVFSQDRARRHLADLRTTSEGVELTPIDSHSRFFLQITVPVRLKTGTRLRIGNYLIEARLPAAGPDLRPALVEGELLLTKDLTSMGELVFIRPDGSDGLRFPILRKVLIGRGGPGDDPVDIPLLDGNVSRKHAAIAPSSTGLKLKNLSQRDGTFVESKNPKLLVEGDRFRLGESLWQLARY